jgi:chromosome segregation ATPase
MENKTGSSGHVSRSGKYFKYAIGEIVLVVIGILIALQINNWNEQRKESKLEQDYYCKLLEDVQQDLVQVKSQITNTDKRIEASNNALQMLQSENPKLDVLMSEMFNSLSLITYTIRPNNAAFEDLKSSGNLNILKDNNIKTSVIDYYSMLEGMIDVMDINADGAVGIFFKKEDYAQFGWQHMIFVKEGIDKNKVNFNNLNPSNTLNFTMIKQLTSDAVFILGANSRVKYLYETVLPDIENMIELLETKCASNQ